MMKPLRIAANALFLVSMLCMASCNRNTYSEWNDCFCPCNKACAPKCEKPCGPACDTPCKAKCEPCASASCGDRGCPKACPCPPEKNPYFPCEPGFFPCGNGGCQKPADEEMCFGRMMSYKTCDDCIVDLCQNAPEFATVGSAYPVEIIITARKECAEVMINQTLPCDSVFVKSEPEAQPDAQNQLHWRFAHLTCGEAKKITVWVKPQKEGCCLATATVCACPQLCAYTNCGQPVICIKKFGPTCACLFCPVPYRIEVCNSGSAIAYDVVVQDTIPEGLSHASGYRCLTYQLGNMCPGDSKTICIDLCASKRGTVTNTATVSYCGGPKCTAEATTIINEPCVQVTKTGADWAYICKPVDYTITVTNPGDMILRDVVVDDVSPAGTTVIAAPGAETCCNRATWCIAQLCPGETKTFTVTVSSQVAGTLTNKVSVTSQSDCGPCTMCAEATTVWKGIAATHMCVVDTVDPICVGQTTVYRICITNRGTSDDTNVQLSLNFSSELAPQSFNGPTSGSISGNTVTFAPIDHLSPKESMEYSVTVKGVTAGNAKAEAKLSSDTLCSPAVSTECTHVY
jgi:uncharacterized repeat protein (TIGR01451 family)